MHVHARAPAPCHFRCVLLRWPGHESERFCGVRGHRAVIGEVIDRRYRIDAELGSGGMGVVYRATHTLIGKQTAIKVLRSQHARDEEAVKRFLREARIASAIEHPHVVDLSDFGQLEDGRLYYVMELLEGRSLASEIDLQGPLSPNRALRVALQVARGLGAAHQRGIVHRDLKPDNIFLCRGSGGEDHVKLFDFGIARAGDSRLTRPGAVLGTPEYMPPEQTMGMGVDARADLYALGVILFEMLTGKVPLHADDVMELFQLQLTARPPALAEVAPALGPLARTQALLDRLLAKRPEDRPPDAEAVQREILDAIAADAPQETRRTTRAMGSGSSAEADEAGEADRASAPQSAARSDPWVPPAPLVALAAPPSSRRTPLYQAGEDTTPMGSVAAAALAIPRAVEVADSSRMSTAPTLAIMASAAAIAVPPPSSGADHAPRVTQPQSLVLTSGRAPVPVPAPARPTGPVPAPRRSWATFTIASAIAAGVLTLGGFGIARLGDDGAEPSRAAPHEIVPAAVAAPLAQPGDASPPPAPAAAKAEAPPAKVVAPPNADPDPPAPTPSPAIDPSPDAGPATAAEHVGSEPTPAEGKPKPRAKKPVTISETTGSNSPTSASKTDAPQKAAPKHPPSGTAPAGTNSADDEPKRKPKRSIDLKDPFGAN
jgi:serine/threonine protein kinase